MNIAVYPGSNYRCVWSLVEVLFPGKASYQQTDETTPNIVGCRELLRPCWQLWCPNGCNNSQQCWDLQCIVVGRIQPTRLWRPCVMRVRGPNNVGIAMQTDPTSLRYVSVINELRNVGSCWLKSLTGCKLCATTPKRQHHGVQRDATCNIQQCWELLANNVASDCTGLYIIKRYSTSLRLEYLRTWSAIW